MITWCMHSWNSQNPCKLVEPQSSIFIEESATSAKGDN